MCIRQMLNVAKWQSGVVARAEKTVHLRRINNTFAMPKQYMMIVLQF